MENQQALTKIEETATTPKPETTTPEETVITTEPAVPQETVNTSTMPEVTVPEPPTQPQKKTINKKLLIGIISAASVIIIAVAIILILNSSPVIYNKAIKLMGSEDYVAAIEQFERIPDYKDSLTQIDTSKVGIIKQYIAKENYTEALASVETLSEDFAEQAQNFTTYINALVAISKNDYESAITDLREVKDFEESKKHLNDTYYLYAEELFTKKDYSEAKTYYKFAEGYDDTEEKATICELMIAEAAYKDGDLPKAKELFQALPKDLSYDGISVSGRLKTLSKYSKYVKMCGEWYGYNGKMTVRQTHKSTGLWDQWDATYSDPLTLKCVINEKKGTVTLKGTAKYYTYTNYSSLSYLLKDLNMTASFEKTIKLNENIPQTLYSSSSTKVTYSGSKFHLDYDYTNANYSMNFTYRYTSSISYSK